MRIESAVHETKFILLFSPISNGNDTLAFSVPLEIAAGGTNSENMSPLITRRIHFASNSAVFSFENSLFPDGIPDAHLVISYGESGAVRFKKMSITLPSDVR